MRSIKVITCIMLSFILCNCVFTTYTEEDFYNSTWESSPSEKIIFNEDETCIVHNIDWDIIFYPIASEMSETPRSFSGNWKIETRPYGEQLIWISSAETKCSFALDIRDKNVLTICIGDPDECNYYKFCRVQEVSQLEDTTKE